MMSVEISLREMSVAERHAYRDHAVEGYIADMVGAGFLDERTARLKADRDYDHLLADPAEEWQHVTRDDVVVGSVIWAIRADDEGAHLFIHDIEIFADYRGQGLGRLAMGAMIAEGRRKNVDAVLLNVFENNVVARSLYRSLGFAVTNVHMRLGIVPA